MSLNKPLLALVMISSAGLAGRAFASTPSTCRSDPDCAHGYICPPAAITPLKATCAPDQDCAVSDGGGTGAASGGSNASVPISTCEPGPCTTDSDCATDMVCHTETSSACSGGTAPACPANTKCDAPPDVAPPTCTTTTTSRCAFRWQLPCSADADCGSGFVCQPSVYGSCSGGGTAPGSGRGGGAGTDTRSGGAETSPSPPDDCTTTTAFPGWCQLAAPTCETDTDCPSNWLCQEGSTGRGTPVNTTGAGGVGGAGGAAEAGQTGSGAAIGADVVATPTTKMCVSPFGTPLDATDGANGGRSGGSETGSTPESPPGTGGTLGTGAAPTAVDSGSGTGGTSSGHDSSAPGASNDSAGCSIIPASGPSGAGAAALLALLGLGLVAVRRRRG